VVQVREYCSGIEYFESQIEAIYYSDGRIKYNGGGNEREYQLSDYQSNTRILFKANDNVTEIIEEYSGYFPYGAAHQQESNYQNKYLNEGKELQTELNLEWSDYHLRCKDNWMGRFLSVDVLADAYTNVSSYSYGLGNPVSNGDPSGASVQKFTGEEAQQVFGGLQNSFNKDVASGKNVTIDANKIGGVIGELQSNPSQSLKTAFGKALETVANNRLAGLLTKMGASEEESMDDAIHERVDGYKYLETIIGDNKHSYSDVTLVVFWGKGRN